ncbi:MAG: serine hydrolase domain-containing protein [Ferruginibacter sp.]
MNREPSLNKRGIILKKKGWIYFSQFFFSVFLFTLSAYMTSCQSASQDKKKIVTDSTLVKIPDPGFLPEAERNYIYQQCRHWYDSVLKNSGFNGGILVAKNGNIVFEEYKGTAHLRGIDSINAETEFHIASVSKTFTAMAVLKLWENKKVQLDSSFSYYFPSFNYPGVTIRTMLDHRSGLPNYLYFMEDLGWDKSKYLTNQDVLDTLIARKQDIKNIGKPDTRFTYCNTNYALLALLVEKVSGQSFSHFMDSTFFKPLQMAHTFIYKPSDSARITPSYDWRGVEIGEGYLDRVYGDKNVYSNVRDLLRWDKALSKTSLLQKNTLDQAYTPYSNERPGIKNYGLGWRMNIYPNNKVIFHNGWWHGNNAVFIRLIPQDATIIVTGNRYTNAIYKAKDLIGLFLNESVVDDITE